jgi:hypothetical protein
LHLITVCDRLKKLFPIWMVTCMAIGLEFVWAFSAWRIGTRDDKVAQK